MTRTNDIHEVFEEQRDEYDDAATVVAGAMDNATEDVTPGLVVRAQWRPRARSTSARTTSQPRRPRP